MLCEKEAENTPSYQFIPTTKLILPEMKSNLPKLGTIPVWYNENSSQILPPKIHQGRLGDASWTRSTPPLLPMVAYKLFDRGKHDQQASEVVNNKATTISDLGVVSRMLPSIHHDMELQHISFESVRSPSVPEKTRYTADNFHWPTMVKEESSLLITKEPVPGASCLMTAYCRRRLENSKLSNCSFQPYQVRPNPLGYFLNLALMFSSFTRAIISHQINHKPNSFNYIINWAHLSKEYPCNGLVTWDPGETHLSILLGLDSTKQKQVLLEENPHVSFSYTVPCFLNVITSSSVHPWQKNIFQVLMREKKIWDGFYFDSGKSKTSLPCPYNFLNDFLSIFHSHNSYWSNVVRDQVVVGIMIAAGKKRPRLKFWYEVLCLIFIDKMNVVGSTQHQWEGYTKKMLHQLLVGMDDFEPNIGIILMAATTLLDIFDPALTRPSRIVMYVVPISDGRGRPESLEFYLQDKSLVANIDVNGTIEFDLANLVNMEALKAAVEGLSLLELVSGASFYGATLAFFPLTLHTKGGITNLLSWFFDRGRLAERSSSAPFSQQPQGQGRGQPPANPSLSQSSSTATKPVCQICSRTGHTAARCYQRFNYEFPGTNDPKGRNFPGDLIDGSSFLLHSLDDSARRFPKWKPMRAQVEIRRITFPFDPETRTHSRFKTETRCSISSYLTFYFSRGEKKAFMNPASVASTDGLGYNERVALLFQRLSNIQPDRFLVCPWYHENISSSYTNKEINEIRDEWAKYVMQMIAAGK
ncbi:hypothetical protein G4B88_015124 [Cannabis sativa]|uniref:ATPase AAA-type core domain-containing protein n=1 Tax=Cannabis sativa TaxID=3483 RepID=A0A7J6F347_CANSA|nr:hypothetical protein G4B88_015124 [Cannabis sativa]